MQVSSSGSVRVDLVGGTLDIEPINLILKNVITLNVATSLKANVILKRTDFQGVEIYSHDYQEKFKFKAEDLTDDKILYSQHFGSMSFIIQILRLFGSLSHLSLELSSGAPAGSGLGGSSAMGVTLFKALCQYTDQPFDIMKTVLKVKSVESRILNQGVAGYQDYFPALKGGILAIKGIEGEIQVEQLFDQDLKNFLEKNLFLIYSGQSRASGINNWEVYKGFFDKKPNVVEGLNLIADISYQTYQAIKEKKYQKILELIGREGEAREKLFPTITTDKIRELVSELKKAGYQVGLKMCGAGGGGCFLLTNHSTLTTQELEPFLLKLNMKQLEFKVESPL